MKNLDSVVNDIIREAFTSGDRANTTPNSNGLADKGGTARQMLSGEWFGSVAWPFDQATSKDFAKASALQAAQAQQGQGEGVGGAANESGKDLVDALLEDSPSYIYADPSTVGYLLNSLRESSLEEVATVIEETCENPSGENLQKLITLAEELNTTDVDPYFVESIISLIETLTEEDAPLPSDDEDKAVDDGSQDEDSEVPSDEGK